jgi:hypothetical protein
MGAITCLCRVSRLLVDGTFDIYAQSLGVCLVCVCLCRDIPKRLLDYGNAHCFAACEFVALAFCVVWLFHEFLWWLKNAALTRKALFLTLLFFLAESRLKLGTTPGLASPPAPRRLVRPASLLDAV